MDENNYRDVISLAVKEEHRKKVDFLLNVVHPEKNLSVPDPWYGGEEGFEDVFKLVKQACDKIAEKISAI
jgi:protein-tyrosine phosphatase